MTGEITYRLHGISRLEKIRFGNLPGVDFETEHIPNGAYGEPATFVMVVSLAAIATLAAYLLKDRKDSASYVEIVECRPDGTKITKRIQLQSSEAVAGKEISAIVKQITGG